MAAIRKSTNYKPGDLPNPFQEGQDRAYGDILFDKMKETRWWRTFVGIGSLALFAIAIILFAYALSRQQIVPVLVNVMPTGEAAYMGEVRQSGVLQVPEAAILFQVKKFIGNLRSISIDSQVLYNNINECYSMITGTYEPIMTRMLRSNSPFSLVGKMRRSVEIESALRVTGNSYQVDWIETSIEPGGSPVNRKMRGIITIKLLPPEPAFIKENPLGIFIENFEWIEL